MSATTPGRDHVADRYLDLLTKSLTRELYLDQEVRNVDLTTADFGDWGVTGEQIRSGLRTNGWRLVGAGADPETRANGNDWPPTAETMVGRARLANVLDCCRRAVLDGIPGDFIETGVWRGGVTILMRAVLDAYGDADRSVWVADSFEGLPAPDGESFPADEGIDFSGYRQLAVTADDVRANFARYDLLDDRVRFLEGWFKDTLRDAPIEQLSVLRLDGDLYQSTIEAISVLYPKLSPGGFCIVDDYGSWDGCREAIDDYRAEHLIQEPITEVDWTGVYWRKASE